MMNRCVIGLLAGLLLFVPMSAGAECSQSCSQKVARILHKAGALIEAEKEDQAIKMLEDFTVSYPAENSFLLFVHLGNLYAGKERSEKAIGAYDQALVSCQEDAALWQNHARVAWDLKRYSQAADSLMQAWQLKPSDELLFNVALAYSHAGKKQQAADVLEKLLNQIEKPAKIEWLETYVSLCLDLQEPRRSLSALERWQKKYQQEPRFWKLKTVLHVRLNNFVGGAAALDVMASIAELKPGDKRLLADLLLQVEVPLRAAELYEELLADAPEDMRLREQLIVAYRIGGRPEQALKYVYLALKHKTSSVLLRHKGEICFELKRYKEAQNAFAELSRLEGESGRNCIYQAYCALKMNDRGTARKVLKKAMKYKKQKKEAGRLLAWLQRSETPNKY